MRALRAPDARLARPDARLAPTSIEAQRAELGKPVGAHSTEPHVENC
jgi:hypothetical protein